MRIAPAASRHAHEQHTQAPGYADHKAGHPARLSKIEGQIRGISRMVTDVAPPDPPKLRRGSRN